LFRAGGTEVKHILELRSYGLAREIDVPGKDSLPRYRLWDTDIGQMFGAFETEEEALSVVRILVSNYGDDIVDDLGLAQELPDGSPGTPLNGIELVRRANEAASEKEVDEPERTSRVIAPLARSIRRLPALSSD